MRFTRGRLPGAQQPANGADRIIQDWDLEDNLTFLRAASGAIQPVPIPDELAIEALPPPGRAGQLAKATHVLQAREA